MDQLCGICFSELDHPITLPCNHNFCNDCLEEMFRSQIKEQRIKELVCPSCTKALDNQYIQFILSEEDYKLFGETAMKTNEIIDAEQNEIMVDCLGGKCDAKFIIWKDSAHYTCPKCQNKYCLNCRKAYHENISCEDAKKFIGQSPEEILLLKNQRDLGLTQCPHCLSFVDKIDGCNFITCNSPICKSKKYFCFTCGVKFDQNNEQNHFGHYENRNPFKGACKVMDPNGKWVESKDFRQEVKVKKTNPKPCPGCKSLNPLECEYQDAYMNSLCICNSVKCKNTAYCLTCGKSFGTLEEEWQIFEHFDLENEFKCKENK